MVTTRECIIIHNALSIVANMCAANTDKIVDLLSEYLFSKEEAEAIKALQHQNPVDAESVALEDRFNKYKRRWQEISISNRATD